MISLKQIVGFDWDGGNSRKSADKHDVSQAEGESIFFGDPLIVAEDSKHSEEERRFHALGQTTQGRTLHVTFTLRENETLIRVISACDMNRKERQFYEQA
ncbi:MAG: BrnT family toxin [Bradyrhizobium sp.]